MGSLNPTFINRLKYSLAICLLITGVFEAKSQMTFNSNPTPNANNVAVNANIELDFDTDIDLLTVHINSTNANEVYDDNIKIIGSQSGQFRGVFSLGADNSILVFNPNISFKAGERITVIVNSLVLSSGAQPATASSFSFLAQAGPFEGGYKERSTAGIPGVVYGHSDWGDYDGDGDIDVVVVGFDQAFDQIARIYNNVNGVFTDIGAGLTGVSDSGCKWGDYDGDGDLDVVIAGLDASFTTRITKIYRNDGGATFTDIGASLTGVDFASVDWGDYDNDGDLDLVVGGRYSFSPDFHSTTIYQNNAGIFTDIGAGLTGVTDGSVNWGDYDADGDMDLLVHGFDESLSRHFIVYRNDGGTFTDTGNALPGFGFSNADWGDYDNDGDLDIAILGGKSAGTDGAFIYQNNAGVFTDVNAGLPDDIEEGSIQWGDYDGDGDLDLLLTGQDYSPGDNITSAIFRNDAGLFTNIQASLEGVAFQSVGDWVDFDGDGDLDIFVAGENIPGDIIGRLYENTIFNPFITTWKTDNQGTSNDDQITIPTTGTGYFYNVNWGDGMTDTDVTGSITHTYATPGTYTVSITGAFPRIYFNAGSFLPQKDSKKLLTIEQWGNIAWTSMNRAFGGCENLRINAVDAPDLSGVTDMSRMFYYAEALNDNINHWVVSNVENMSGLFRDATVFNQPLDTWEVTNVTDMSDMFYFARAFNQPINFNPGNGNDGGDAWNTTNVTNMASMFGAASEFNQDIGGWDVSNVTSMSGMFSIATKFDQDISSWTIGNGTIISGMFSGATVFNQDISGWNTTGVTSMAGLFRNAQAFNQNINGWDITSVINMSEMFSGAIAFNQDISGWDVSGVTNMRGMFSGNTTFNQNINSWIVDNVLDMEDMFAGATSFNQNIGSWIVTEVNDMSGMFDNATAFNQDISGWDVSGVSDMRLMFQDAAAFDQDLGGWNYDNLSLAVNMFRNSGLSVANYDNLLIGLNAQIASLNSTVSFGAQGVFYCSATTERAALVTLGWSITDGGSKCITLYDGPDTASPEIANGQLQAIDYGSINTPNPKSRTYTLLNNQSIPITNVQIVNPDMGFPTSITFPSIAAVSTQTFTVDLAGPVGTYTETVSITSDDFGGSFLYDVTGEVTTTPEPEIKVFEGITAMGTELLSGISSYYLGEDVKGTDLMGEITITNLGSSALNISNISISGTVFSVLSATSLSIPVDGSEVVQIELSGIQAGIFVETLTIESDDSDEAVFGFVVNGDIIGPDIAVFNGPDRFSYPEIFDGQAAAIDFGSGPVGADIIIPITVANYNRADLFISNISISGTAFSLTAAPPTFIAAEVDGVISTATFDIMLSGAASGTFNESITIVNDDEDEPNFTFSLSGVITTPEIEVYEGGTVSGTLITDGQATAFDFGSDIIGNDITRQITIENAGTQILNISSISISGSAFSLVTVAPVSVGIGASETINIMLSGASIGVFNETLTITNDDSDEGVFDFPITGEIMAIPEPEINVYDGASTSGSVITDGQATAIDFGSGLIGNDIIRQITVENTGAAILNISTISFTGSAFSLSAAAPATVGIGATETIDIVLSGATIGVFTETISINSDDADEGVFNFELTGEITATAQPEIAVYDGGNIASPLIVDGQATPIDFGSDFQGTDITRQITIENKGSAVLSISAITISGTAFSIQSSIPSSLAIGANITLDIMLSGATVGVFSETLTINSNDLDEGVFDFPITGEITAVQEAVISLVVDGVSRASGESIVFDDALVGSSNIRELTITNSGNADLVITNINIVGDDFELLSALPSPLAPTESTILLIEFSPTSLGPKSAVLTIVSQAAPDFTAVLSANGLSDIPEIEIFNVVTVNQNGKHDYLEIRNIEFYTTSKVYIFSRWGNEVFTTTDYNNTTNRFVGNSSDGDKLPDGTYYYLIELNGGEVVKNGFFLLRR